MADVKQILSMESINGGKRSTSILDRGVEYKEKQVDGNLKEMINPDEMLTIIKKFIEYLNLEKVDTEQKDVSYSLAKDFVNCMNLELTPTEFLHSYEIYVQDAMVNMNIRTMCMLNLRYLETGRSIEAHKDFPSEPPSLLDYYWQKKGIFDGFEKKTKTMDYDIVGKAACQKDIAKLNEDYARKLKEFLKKHESTLSPRHKKFAKEQLEKAIKKHIPMKKSSPPTPKPKKEKKEHNIRFTIKPEKNTAFTYFELANRQKYLDMEKWPRFKKLYAEFGSLEPKVKEIFEKLAD